MAHIVADRVRDTTTSTTSPFTVSGTSPSTYRAFSAVCANNDTIWITIVHQTANEWEVGLYTSNGSTTLTRTTVLASSNAGAAVTFSAGTKDVIAIDPANNILPEGTTAEYLANTANRALSTDQVNAAGAPQTLSDAATVAWDMALGFNAQVTLQGDRTLGTPTNYIVGRTGMLIVTQHSSGGPHTLDYHTDWQAAGGTFPVLSIGASDVDIIFYIIRAANQYVITGILKDVV